MDQTYQQLPIASNGIAKALYEDLVGKGEALDVFRIKAGRCQPPLTGMVTGAIASPGR